MKRTMMNRRDFLRTSAAAGAGLALVGGAGAALAAPAPKTSRGAASYAYTPPPGSTSGTLSISAFGGAAEHTLFGNAAARFNKTYPNVKVNLSITTVANWSDYANKLITQVAGGKIPDIVEIASEGVRLFVAKGLAGSIQDYATNDPAGVAGISKTLLDGMSVDNKLYFVPENWNNMVIYYNTKMFADAKIEPPKPDWTWDDFLQIAKELTTGSGKTKVYGLGLPYGGIFFFMPWWLTNGTYPMSADLTKSNLSDPKVIEAVSFMNDLVNKYKVAPAVQGTDPGQLFPARKVAMSGWGRWIIESLDAAKFHDYDIQYWPRKTAATSVYGVGGFGINPHTKNKDLAWELIKALTSKTVAEEVVADGSAIPCIEEVANSPAFLKAPPNAKIFYASLNSAKEVANPVNFNQFEQIVLRHVGDILAGHTDVETGMKAADKELAAAMQQVGS